MNGICGGILVARAGVDTATISTPRRAARGSQCPSTPGVVLAAETVGRAALIGWRFHGGHHLALQIPREWVDIRKAWFDLTAYQRFETVAALVLRLVIALIIAVALYRLVAGVIGALLLRVFNPLDHAVFQVVFGGIMTVLITLEFGHTLQYFFTRGRGIIQAKIVIVIALLALARKVIVTDPFEAAPASVFALAALTLALGVTYWLMREHEHRLRASAAEKAPAAPRSTA